MKTESKKLAYIEGIGSIILNTILFIFKYWVGIMTGSIAIIADAWHTLSDSLTSIIVIFGARVKLFGKGLSACEGTCAATKEACGSNAAPTPTTNCDADGDGEADVEGNGYCCRPVY